MRAGRLGLPMALAIIGGMPARFTPLAQLFRESLREGGHDPALVSLSINSHGFIADTAREAADTAWPPFEAMMTKIGRERGWSPVTRAHFDSARSPRGSDFVGTPDEVIEKILNQQRLFGHQRFLLQLGIGTIPHDKMMHAIELFGTRVAPAVRSEIARRIAG